MAGYSRLLIALVFVRRRCRCLRSCCRESTARLSVGAVAQWRRQAWAEQRVLSKLLARVAKLWVPGTAVLGCRGCAWGGQGGDGKDLQLEDSARGRARQSRAEREAPLQPQAAVREG